jgi:hypothetical protein
MSTREGRVALSLDTPADVEAQQVERWRTMSPRQKAVLVKQMSETADAMALAGIRAAYPAASAHERFLRLAIRRLGLDLAVRVYPEIANLED